MIMYCMRLALVVVATLTPGLAWAQHDAHQAGAPRVSSVELTQCVRVQPVIENIITAATARAEAARLSNSPTELRAAIDHVEAALRDIRAQLAPCVSAAAATDPHAGHPLPSTTPSATTPSVPPPTGVVDPHAGHSPSQSGDKQMDPVNGLMVDPATALKTTFQGRTYYFSSEHSRKEFLENPAKFAKKPKG
jgi:YHS domain-containing protein